MQRTSSIRSETLVMTSGSQSLANPGSTPLTKMEALPAAAASRIGSASGVAISPTGNCRKTGLLDTTLIPRRRKPARSSSASVKRSSAIAVCTMQSGSSANSASASVVAATPSVRPNPASSPASLPSFDGFDTQTPTSSRSGRASMPAIACLPTLPVLHCTTRSVTVPLLSRLISLTVAHRSGRWRSRLGSCSPPSTSISLPVM